MEKMKYFGLIVLVFTQVAIAQSKKHLPPVGEYQVVYGDEYPFVKESKFIEHIPPQRFQMLDQNCIVTSTAMLVDSIRCRLEKDEADTEASRGNDEKLRNFKKCDKRSTAEVGNLLQTTNWMPEFGVSSLLPPGQSYRANGCFNIERPFFHHNATHSYGILEQMLSSGCKEMNNEACYPLATLQKEGLLELANQIQAEDDKKILGETNTPVTGSVLGCNGNCKSALSNRLNSKSNIQTLAEFRDAIQPGGEIARQIFSNSCGRVKVPTNDEVKVVNFNSARLKNSPEFALKIAKTIINSENVPFLTSTCYSVDSSNRCKESHQVLIVGYSEVCRCSPGLKTCEDGRENKCKIRLHPIESTEVGYQSYFEGDMVRNGFDAEKIFAGMAGSDKAASVITFLKVNPSKDRISTK